MRDQVYNIAEAKMHLSRLIERVESGEQITIARNNRPVAVVSAVRSTPGDILARIDALRARLCARDGDRVIESPQTWRDLIEEGRHLS